MVSTVRMSICDRNVEGAEGNRRPLPRPPHHVGGLVGVVHRQPVRDHLQLVAAHHDRGHGPTLALDLLERGDGGLSGGQQRGHDLLRAATVSCRRSWEDVRKTFQRPRPTIVATAAAMSEPGSARRQPGRSAGRAGARGRARAEAPTAPSVRREPGPAPPPHCRPQAGAEVVGGLGGREISRAMAHQLGGLGDGGGAAVAAGQVDGEDRLVLRLEGVQRPADSELVEDLVVGRRHVAAVPGHRPGPSTAAVCPRAPPGRPDPVVSPSSAFSRRMPASIRVLTVPRGVPVRAATSRCV